jgi:hypothetical protein
MHVLWRCRWLTRALLAGLLALTLSHGLGCPRDTCLALRACHSCRWAAITSHACFRRVQWHCCAAVQYSSGQCNVVQCGIVAVRCSCMR